MIGDYLFPTANHLLPVRAPKEAKGSTTDGVLRWCADIPELVYNSPLRHRCNVHPVLYYYAHSEYLFK